MIKGDFSEGEVERGKILADAVNLARTLVNEPPNVCTPSRLAELAVSMGGDDVQVTVLGKAEIEARGMGGVIAVSQGATEEPKFIHIHYRPSGESRGSLALIGKGLTFDSGGLSLKPPKSQEMMHIDMGGAAAVLGAMRAICSLKPDVEVHGIVGSCENMPDGNSYRPSDILTMYSKKTVEVLNTDAEGRLVLADALHYATELNPDAMVNLATLTGACMVGLGTNYCGLFSDNDAWAGALLAAGERAGEKLWRLPLDEGLADTLKSKRADIKNLGGPYGGAITAALFLKNFKGECTWAHMDIAGPVTADKAKGVISAGGTGFGVLTLVDLAEQFSPIVETAAP
jgi:leucyl aminopeptidase